MIPERKSRSSLAVRSYTVQIDSSKEPEELKANGSLAVSLKKLESAPKVCYVLNVDQMKHEELEMDGMGESPTPSSRNTAGPCRGGSNPFVQIEFLFTEKKPREEI